MTTTHMTGFRILAAALALAWAAPARADSIVFTDPKKSPRLNITVSKETCKEVVFASAGGGTGETTLPAKDVKAVLWGDAPDEYRVGETEFRSGRWAEAATAFEKAKSGKARPWLGLYCDFYLGECRRRLGEGDPAQIDAAIKHYDAALAAQADTRLIVPLKNGLAACHREKKAYGAAEQVLKGLLNDVTTYGLDPRVGILAEIEIARLLEAKGEFAGAGARYTSLVGRVPNGMQDVANLAKMRAGLCLVAEQKFPEAKSHFESLLRGAAYDEAEVQAGAHLGLGHCFYRQNEFQQARIEYLTVNAQFGTTEYHAEATYFAARCYVQREEQEEQARAHAKRLFTEILVLHPKSPWAQKAFDDALKVGATREELERYWRRS